MHYTFVVQPGFSSFVNLAKQIQSLVTAEECSLIFKAYKLMLKGTNRLIRKLFIFFISVEIGGG